MRARGPESQAQTGALSVVVTMRPEPEANLRILRHAFGQENVLALPPAELREAGDAPAVEEDDRFEGAPEWAAAIRAHAESKIYATVCRGFVAAWRAGGRPAAALPPPPDDIDGAYGLWLELQPPAADVRRLLGQRPPGPFKPAQCFFLTEPVFVWQFCTGAQGA